jgi:hypothetical protein
MCEAFEEGIACRETHTPALFHVEELTQPQGPIQLLAVMNVIKPGAS